MVPTAVAKSPFARLPWPSAVASKPVALAALPRAVPKVPVVVAPRPIVVEAAPPVAKGKHAARSKLPPVPETHCAKAGEAPKAVATPAAIARPRKPAPERALVPSKPARPPARCRVPCTSAGCAAVLRRAIALSNAVTGHLHIARPGANSLRLMAFASLRRSPIHSRLAFRVGTSRLREAEPLRGCLRFKLCSLADTRNNSLRVRQIGNKLPQFGRGVVASPFRRSG